MLTFDEAVEKMQRCPDVGVHLAYADEAAHNEIVRRLCHTAMTAVAIGLDPTGCLIGLFLAGVNVGREMEKQDLSLPNQTH